MEKGLCKSSAGRFSPPQVADESHREEAESLENREHRNSKKKSEQTSDVGQKIDQTVARESFVHENILVGKVHREWISVFCVILCRKFVDYDFWVKILDRVAWW